MPTPVVDIPRAADSGEPDSERLPAPAPVAAPHDALDYYVGTWDGLAIVGQGASRKTWETVLEVRSGGSFRVLLGPGQARACGLSGRLHLEANALVLHVQANSCDPVEVGRMAREIVSKTPDAFELRTSDGQSSYRYTRRLLDE
jgi:hypothetical protein